MEQEQLNKFRAWFDSYVGGLYGSDEYVNANLKLKEQHTHRTCKESLYLADQLGLDANSTRLSELAALFHDIGRFEQFVKYRTYNDIKSANHCLLGLEVLRRTNVLNGVETEERELIEKAIEYHGLKKLPKDLNSRPMLLSKLLRDADKLDVFYVATEYYTQYRDNQDKFMLEMEFPDEPTCSAEVIEGILYERLVDYSSLRTLNDMRLLQLGWVYDINFAATLERIKQRKFLEKIIDFLPETNDVEKVRKKIFEYVDHRIEKEE